MPPIFGYGSLILPTSLVSRFEDLSTNIDDVYQGNTDKNIRTDALKRWEEQRERILYIPAKIWGFRRYYSLESDRGGTMLEAVRTDNPEDWINGVLIFGLTAEEEEQIIRTESMYDYTDVRNPRLEFYIDNGDISELDLTEINRVRLFANNDSIDNISADSPRNQTYHSRIVTGIGLIGEMYGTDLADHFYEDFRRLTYEIAYDSEDTSEFNTVKENDLLKGDLNWKVSP
jgi:hypothetical protein